MTIEKISPIDGNSAAIERYQAMIDRSQPSRDAAVPAAPSATKNGVTASGADDKGPSVKKETPTFEEYKQRVDKLNAQLSANNIRLSFGLEGKVFYLKVIDMNNGEVIKQVPPKEIVEYMNRTEQDIASLAQQKLV